MSITDIQEAELALQAALELAAPRIAANGVAEWTKHAAVEIVNDLIGQHYDPRTPIRIAVLIQKFYDQSVYHHKRLKRLRKKRK